MNLYISERVFLIGGHEISLLANPSALLDGAAHHHLYFGIIF